MRYPAPLADGASASCNGRRLAPGALLLFPASPDARTNTPYGNQPRTQTIGPHSVFSIHHLRWFGRSSLFYWQCDRLLFWQRDGLLFWWRDGLLGRPGPSGRLRI